MSEEQINNHTYRLKYDLQCETGEFTVDECKEFGGGTDALAVISLLFPKDGSCSMEIRSIDGRNPGTPLSAKELFSAWLLFAAMLAKNKELDQSRRAVCHSAVEHFWSTR